MTVKGDPLPISLVCHTVFCPRRTWLEANGEKTDTYQMQAGHTAHRRVDNSAESRPNELRSLTLASRELGLSGRADLVRTGERSVELVEYKATPLRGRATVTRAQEVQLALQAACLREAGYEVSGAAVRFADHNRTIRVDLTGELDRTAQEYVSKTRAIVDADHAPAPLIDDARCTSCSHISVCLPDERQEKLVRRGIRTSEVHGKLLHATVPGSRVSLSRGRVRVSRKGEELADVPLEIVEGIVVHGNIDLSSALVREVLWRSQTIVWCSSTGRVYGWTQPADGPNGLARSRQHVIFDGGYLPVACEMIRAKLLNQATILRRNSAHTVTAAKLRSLARAAAQAPAVNVLFGIEGEGAGAYFAMFGDLVKERAREKYGFEWGGRVGRGATDPLNILLNYAYGMLTAECIRALVACGLDPHAGVLHSSARNKPALALDLMEEFRPLIADSAVIGMLNRLAFPLGGLHRSGSAMRLSKEGRKSIIRAVETRLGEEFTHPVFGYKVSWRRAIEVQARMVLGVIEGTQPSYKGVVTR
ncbi:CRISPR-associated endonuclease Cas1 [Corynebacterium sp. LK2510]|uniref:CRISPR-associated endonuclease Cas1 n=1 Tax=Corynebacterium sp. LK2510 TaxID=3110472 RepID=UPI0034CE4215